MVMSSRQSLVDMALLMGLWLVWGYSWVASKLGLEYASPLQMAEYRLTLALLTLGGLLLWRRGRFSLPPLWPTFWLGLTQTTGFTLLSTLALLNAGTGKVTILCYTMPFWTLLLARFFLREHLRPVQWLAVLLAFCRFDVCADALGRQHRLARRSTSVGGGCLLGYLRHHCQAAARTAPD